MQPIAAADVAAILADIVTSASLPFDGEGLSASLPFDGEGLSASLPFDGEGLREGWLLNTTIEIAGPEPIRMDDLARQYLAATSRSSPLDPRPSVTTYPNAGYFGTPVNDESLTPGQNARLGRVRFADWLAAQ